MLLISYISSAASVFISFDIGRQLKSLARYLYEDYFDNNSLIILETIYGKYNFRVFSVHKIDDDKEYIKQIKQKELAEFIQDCTKESIFPPKNTTPDDSVILTFTTDIDDYDGNRLLIHAYLESD